MNVPVLLFSIFVSAVGADISLYADWSMELVIWSTNI